MSKKLPTTKYFLNNQYESNPQMVNKDVTAAIGVNFGPYGSYDNALGRYLIETKMGKKFFNHPAASIDPEVARYELDKNLP